MFRNIRTSLGLNRIKKKSSKITRNRKVQNFETAKSAAILFDAAEDKSFNHIKGFKKYLDELGINTELTGYVDEDEIPDALLLWENCQVYCKKDLNLIYQIKDQQIENFLTTEYDILFDLSLEDHIPLIQLSSISISRFKVGRYKESFNDYDLMINIEDQNRIEFFIEQIKNYVSILNKD